MTWWDRILPARFDGDYRGGRLALWLLGSVLFVKGGIALGVLFNGRAAARRADGIPLDSFGADGAAAVVALFAIWGLAQLVPVALGVLALARYRSMVPFVFLVFVIEHLARRLILIAKPIVRTGTPPGLFINLALLAMMTVGLVLSLRSRRDAPARP